MTRFHTTVTERASFRSCRRSWYLENVEQLRAKGRVTWYLIYGDVMHTSLDCYYRPKTSRSVRPPRNIATTLDAFQEAWAVENEKLKVEYGPLYGMGIEEEWYGYYEMGRQTLIYYDRFDRKDPFFDKVLAVGVEDRSFVDILEPPNGNHLPDFPLLSGRIDLVIERPDGVYIWDHKNLASKASDRALDVDDQVTGYCYIWYRLSGKRPRGVYYNVLIKDPPKPPRLVKKDTELSQDKSQRTTYDLYLDALKEQGFPKTDYTEYLTYLCEKGWAQFFQRLGPITRNEQELDSFERRLYHEMVDMKDALEMPDFRYPNPSQYTCPGCTMISLCQLMEEQGDVEYLKETMYEVKPPRHEIPEDILAPTWEGV